jgi:hypothetical protein
MFTDRKNNKFLMKWIIMVIVWNLHSMNKLSGWLGYAAEAIILNPRLEQCRLIMQILQLKF